MANYKEQIHSLVWPCPSLRQLLPQELNIKVLCTFVFFKFILRETDRVSAGGAGRDGERESQAGREEGGRLVGSGTHEPWDDDLSWNQELDA